jgi:glycosyltransferase involved in cell wall biosynthesis
MRFSILICTHNRCQVLPRALEAMARLDVPEGEGWELVVVDNASDDATRQVVEEFAARASMPVRYVHEGRLGHSYALNSGVAACRGEVIAFTDDDALPKPDWLRRIDAVLDGMQAHWVFGKAVPVWPAQQPPWFSQQLNRYFALLDYGPERFVVTDRKHTFFGVNHACRREALEALGGYRTDRGIYGGQGMGLGVGNDTDLFERALDAGMKVVYDPAVQVGHIIPVARATKAYNRRIVWINTRSYYRFLCNDPPAVPWLLGLPRYFYGFALGRLLNYVKNVALRRRGAAFADELELIRFAGLFREARRSGFRRPGGARPGAGARPREVAARLMSTAASARLKRPRVHQP